MRAYDIWMEGYAATGESAPACKLNDELIWAESFNEAVKKYQEEHPDTTIEPYTRDNFISDEAYENRRSNWKIWGCGLFPDEAMARESFG